MSDQVAIVLIASGWSGAVGLIGGLVGWLLRRSSLRWQVGLVSLVAITAVLAGMLGTARAMFISDHDFGVMILVAVVAGFVAAVFAYAIGSGLVRGSDRLRREAKNLGSPHAFAPDTSGPAELTALGEELRATSARLAESREREQKLEAARRELVSWVSHDLRTPLAAMRAMAEALEDGMVDEPDRYHRQIRSEVDRMVRMVDDLFTLSRIHAGVLQIRPEPLLLGDVVSEAIATARPIARRSQVHLDGEAPPGTVVHADPAELTRAVGNLVVNAIRHTPEGGAVRLSGQAHSEGIELSVADACGGIPDEDLSRVFDVAWQGDPARMPVRAEDTSVDREQGNGSGAGLGLAIVKGIVEAHSGTLSVSNDPPGCRFVLTLPRQLPD